METDEIIQFSTINLMIKIRPNSSASKTIQMPINYCIEQLNVTPVTVCVTGS